MTKTNKLVLTLGAAAALTGLVLLTQVLTSQDQAETSSSVTIQSVQVQVPKPTPAPELKDKSIKTLHIPTSQIVPIVGEIGQGSFLIAEAITELARKGRPVYVLINSPGGSVFDGALIVAAIEASKTPVYTVCMQLCASMAAVIHQHGHQRYMQDRSILMFHDAAGGLQGSLPQMQSRLDTITRFVNKFNAKISSNANMSLEAFNQRILREWWIDAEDSTELGFNQQLVQVNIRGSLAPAITEALNSTKGIKTIKRLDIQL